MEQVLDGVNTSVNTGAHMFKDLQATMDSHCLTLPWKFKLYSAFDPSCSI